MFFSPRGLLKALIPVKSTNLDQSNITTIATPPCALFPVPVIGLCSTVIPFLPSHHVIQGALSRPFHLSPHLGGRGLVTHYVSVTFRGSLQTLV